jgi:RimJ/RimL family protein N-acetyltransferase
VIVETERLLLCKPRAEDAADLAVACADPETVRFIGDGSTATPAEVERGIGGWLERWESWGLSLFSLERREDGRVLGRAGFLRWDPEAWVVGGTETELGWLLAREHWGQGNARSIRVAERLERYERGAEVQGKRSRLYSIER